MTLRSPYKQARSNAGYAATTPRAPRGNVDPMSIDARQAATQRGPYDYLKPRPRHDGIVQSANFPQGSNASAREKDPRVVGTIDTSITPEALPVAPRGFLRNAWPTFKEFSTEDLARRGESLIDALDRQGLQFQALTVGKHEGRPTFLLYLDRALRANELVPLEHDGIRVQRMTVGKFR